MGIKKWLGLEKPNAADAVTTNPEPAEDSIDWLKRRVAELEEAYTKATGERDNLGVELGLRIEELEDKVDALQAEAFSLKEQAATRERDLKISRERSADLSSKLERHKALLKKIDRELGFGKGSPLDWAGEDDRALDDFFDALTRRFRDGGISEISLRHAHEALCKQVEPMKKELEGLRSEAEALRTRAQNAEEVQRAYLVMKTKVGPILDMLEAYGMPKDTSIPATVAWLDELLRKSVATTA